MKSANSLSRVIIAWMVAILILCAQSVKAQSENLAIVGATVISATGAPALPNATILIEGGRIQFVGPSSGDLDLSGYRVIELGGKWVTPGLIDTNVHLILMTVPEFFIKYEDRFEEIAIQSAQVGLKYGMTTMADSWGPLEPLIRARDRINAGEIVGSRVLVAGNIVGLGGPFSPYFMGGWEIGGLSLRNGGWVHPIIQQRINDAWEAGVGPELLAMTPDEAAAAMREYIEKGVDFVKVAISGHGIEPVEPLMFSAPVLQAMRDEVSNANLPFQTHTFTIESLRMALPLNPDLLQHPNVMNPSWLSASEPQKEAIQSLIAEIESKGIYSGLMAVPEKEQIRLYQEWDITENQDRLHLNKIMANRQLWFTGVTYDDMAAGIRVWLDADIPYTLATDQGPDTADLGDVAWGRLGRAHFDRLIGLQDAGADPMEILIAATRNGAAAYRLLDDLGTIEEGKIADLLVLDADPLADIANMRQINLVIKDGVIIDRESLPTINVLDYDPEASWPY